MIKLKIVFSILAALMILLSSFGMAAADNGTQEDGIIEPNPVIGDPHPIAPNSYIYTKYPTFFFTQFEEKTRYRILVYKADKVTLYYKYKGTADCYLSECVMTPDIPLTGLYGLIYTGIYYWRVEVKMDDGSWFGPPALVQFSRLKPSFYSDFNLHRKKWQDIAGVWELASAGYLKNTGVVGEYTSAAYQGYIVGNYTYEAKIKLKSKHVYLPSDITRQSGGIIVNGYPITLTDANIWSSGVYIQIRNDQKARIFEYWNDEYVDTLDTGWVTVDAIKPDDWNTIRVIKVGGNLLVKINDVDWMTYTDPVHNIFAWSGFVGFTHSRVASETEKMLVDLSTYAKLSD